MIPGPGEKATRASKDAIAVAALGLLDEQVKARIVHYKAELETNPELDAITANVVAELRQLQQSLAANAPEAADQREAILAEQERTLAGLLARLFPTGAPSLIVEKRIKQCLRSLAKIFFQSELHEQTRGKDGSIKTIQHGEQAMYYLLTRYSNRMKNELANFTYESEEVRERSFDVLTKFTKDMQDAFLSRRSSELKRLVKVFNGVLVEVVAKELPKVTASLAGELVREASSEDQHRFGYKLTNETFPAFRAAFERRLMTTLVEFSEDELLKRLADTAGPEREETVRFIANPEVFSMICGEIASGAYEFLYSEGFLDLPPEWVHSNAQSF